MTDPAPVSPAQCYALRPVNPFRGVAAVGISRIPLNPNLDVGRMLEKAAELVTALDRYAGILPFPLLPEIEHWLLDQNSAPLALLGTAIEESELDETGGNEWSAGGRSEHPFKRLRTTTIGVINRHTLPRHLAAKRPQNRTRAVYEVQKHRQFQPRYS